jgi:hypothetical protein
MQVRYIEGVKIKLHEFLISELNRIERVSFAAGLFKPGQRVPDSLAV